MTAWFLKDCPKCGGDLYEDSFVSGEQVKCLQCGLQIKSAFLYRGGKHAGQTNTDMKDIRACAAHNN